VNGSRIVVCLVLGVLVLTPVLAFASHALAGAAAAPAKQQTLRHQTRSRTAWRNLTATLDVGAAPPVVGLLEHSLPEEQSTRLSLVSFAVFVPPRS
jgi:hypothetical protein